MDIRGVFDLLQRRWILIAAGLMLALMVAATSVFVLGPEYRATALVMVQPADIALDDSETRRAAGLDSRIASEALLARADAVLLEVIAGLELADDPDLMTSSTLAGFAQRVRVDHIPDTTLLAISAEAATAEKAALWANAVAETYIGRQLHAKRQAAQEAHALLQAEIAEARTRIIRADGAFATFIADHAETIASQTGNAEITRLADELLALRARRQQATASASQLELERMATEEAARAEVLRGLILSAPLPSDLLAALYDLGRSTELARQRYDLLMARAEEAEARARLQLADSRLVSPALPAAAPLGPGKAVIFGLAGILGLALGVLAAFGWDSWAGSVTNTGQLAGLTRRPMALGLPKTLGMPADLIVSAPHSGFAQAVRRLRMTLERMRQPDGPAPIVVVTSAKTGEGKSTLALALGRCCAAAGRSTLLIDGDLHAPALQALAGLRPQRGFADMLSGLDTARLAPGMIVMEHGGLAILPGHRNPEGPADLTRAGRALPSLFSAARRTFEMIIVDTPALEPGIDGMILCQHADVVILAAKWSATSEAALRRALETLEQLVPRGADILPVLTMEKPARQAAPRPRGSALADAAS